MYQVTIDKFEGPLDLLLHLIKQSDIDIYEIKIEEIVNQYLNYIKAMEQLNLDVASEYLSYAAELIEMKSKMLLPKTYDIDADDYEEDPREQLINRLLVYKQYKEITSDFRELEQKRKELYTREVSTLREYREDVTNEQTSDELNLDLLIEAFNNFMLRQVKEKPLNTKVTNKEYSVTKRSAEIVDIVSKKKKVEFLELFEEYNKSYFITTFLSILNLAKKSMIKIEQDDNFKKIYLLSEGMVK